MPPVYIIFGVSGSGKTTIAQKLSTALSIPFFDADDFHPVSNVEKMKAGVPLNDDDRFPWLETLSNKIAEWNEARGAVLACSALKEKYRDILEGSSNLVRWVFLEGSHQLIVQRMEARKGHFMPPALLKSQFESLEEPIECLKVSIENTPTEIVGEIIEYFKEHE
ncbi:MAG: gluconokinase [Balneola sp.]|nr:MAG: gluconokinase [Balneola sp.]